MQNITLSVDSANDGNAANQVFSLIQPSEGKSFWTLDGAPREDREEMTLYSTPAKRSGNFQGVYRSGIKFHKGIEVEGVDATTLVNTGIISNLSVSVPVGATLADVVEVQQRLLAFIDSNTFVQALMLDGNCFPGS